MQKNVRRIIDLPQFLGRDETRKNDLIVDLEFARQFLEITRHWPFTGNRQRREMKRRLVSSALESPAKDGRRCVQKKCAAVERAPAPECWSNCAARGTKLATACCKPAETRIVVKNESPVLERRRSYPTGTSPHFRASAR